MIPVNKIFDLTFDNQSYFQYYNCGYPDHDLIIVRFTTTYAISGYHH